MLRNIALKSIYDRRRGMVWWVIALVALVGLQIALYPSLAKNVEDLTAVLEKMPKEFLALFASDDAAELLTPAGYLQTRVFIITVPLMMLIYTIGFGARIVAGEEEARTLDLLLANPVRRSQVVLQGFAALTGIMLAFGLVMFATTVVGAAGTDMQLAVLNIAAIVTHVIVLALVFGAIALLLGALSGRRAMSSGITATLAIGTYLLNQLGEQVSWLKPLRPLSPFYYTFDHKPLQNGFAWLHLGVLLAVIAVAVGAAVFAFECRDVAV